MLQGHAVILDANLNPVRTTAFAQIRDTDLLASVARTSMEKPVSVSIVC